MSLGESESLGDSRGFLHRRVTSPTKTCTHRSIRRALHAHFQRVLTCWHVIPETSSSASKSCSKYSNQASILDIHDVHYHTTDFFAPNRPRPVYHCDLAWYVHGEVSQTRGTPIIAIDKGCVRSIDTISISLPLKEMTFALILRKSICQRFFVVKLTLFVSIENMHLILVTIQINFDHLGQTRSCSQVFVLHRVKNKCQFVFGSWKTSPWPFRQRNTKRHTITIETERKQRFNYWTSA